MRKTLLMKEEVVTKYRVNYDLARLIYLTAKDRKIDAIKHFRKLTDLGLRESKDMVERIMEMGRLETPSFNDEDILIEVST